ncbi:MAG: family 16 glycosylhydrolase [Bacteroidales bacterium]|nr:family 16 glycosylhydrolase [Bacteroidales bacterium]
MDITEKLFPILWDRYWCDELQIYRPENCVYNSVNKEWLHTALRVNEGLKPFNSGCLSSINKGRTEGIIFDGVKGEISLRCRFDNFRGAFPAAWLLPFGAPKGAIYEIDIFEWISQEPRILHMTNHWGEDYGTKNHKMRGRNIKGDWLGYHTYGLKWNKLFMWWKIDGRTRKVIFNRYRKQKLYLLINLAIGGWAEDPLPEQSRLTMNTKEIEATGIINL